MRANCPCCNAVLPRVRTLTHVCRSTGRSWTRSMQLRLGLKCIHTCVLDYEGLSGQACTGNRRTLSQSAPQCHGHVLHV